ELPTWTWGNNSLLVRVGDTNDNPPMFSQAVLEVSFPENNLPGERASPLSSEAPGSIFSIDPDSGDVSVQAVLDREQRDTYEFQVTARDKGVPSLQGSTTVVVRVSDRNDNEPHQDPAAGGAAIPLPFPASISLSRRFPTGMPSRPLGCVSSG
uniref:Cadherin domain-containing protein n=1 Tax=Zonotrichia albicollis TaxID=44394 RepID=A0A8D2MEK8_ZONAL